MSAPGSEWTDPVRIEELVIANRILADQRILDAFGHVSVRSARNRDRYFMSRSLAPAMVTADDILEFDFDNIALTNEDQPVYAERFIHGRIYKARDDVEAIVHTHSLGILPFSISDVPMRPVVHTAGFLAARTPVFDIRDVPGEVTGMLVKCNEHADVLARVLGESPVVLMRGHGNTVVGNSLRQVVYRSVYTEVNASIQMHAAQLGGEINCLSDAERAAHPIEITHVDRPWEIWKRQAMKDS